MEERHQIYEIEDLKFGDHLCCLYETDQEHKSLLTPYMRVGLENNEKVFYIVDVHTSETVLDYLRDDGVDVEPYLQSGQLTILTVSESYMKGGVFDPDEMIKMLTEETEKALKEGYNALRVTGEMSWALKGLPGSDRLIEYEAKLNEFFPESKALAICQYDMRLFKPELLLNILLTHPLVVIGTRIYENFYFMPPEKYPFDIPESTLKEWIRSLKVYNDANQFRENILNSMMDGLSVLDAHGVHQDVNDALCKMTGFYREELIGTSPPHPYWPEEETENIQIAFEKTLKGEFEEFELIFKRKNGERFPVIVSPSIMRDEKDNIIAALATVKDISERKNAEDKIKHSQWITKTILESSKDSMFLLDDPGIILEVNQATAERFNTTPEEMIGKHIKNFISPELFKSRWKYFDKAIKTKKIIEFEDERDGLFFYHSISPILEEGKVKKLAVFSRDVTESKKAELHLKESNSKLEATLKAIPDLMFEVDDEGRFYDYFAPETDDLYVSSDAFMGKKVSEILPKDAAHKILEAIKKASLKGSHRGTIYSLDLPSGQKWFELSITKKDHDSSHKNHYIALARNITERKKNEESLQHALNYNRNLLEASIDPLVTIGADGKITDINGAVELVTGYKREDIIGTDFSDYFTNPLNAKKSYEKVFHDGFVKDYPLKIVHKDGHVTPVLYNASVYHDEHGEVLGVFASARDISSLKNAENEIKKQITLTNSINRVLQDSLKAKKEEDVASISLQVAEKLTKSEFGLIMEVNDVGNADTIAVSDPGWLKCQIPQPEAVKLLSGMEISSYWGRVIKEGKSQIVNHPEFDPDSRGVPEGHPTIHSFLGVPLKRGDKTIGLIGLANKVGGYDHIDLEQVETLAVAFIEALYNKRAEESIEESLKEKEMLLKEIHHRVKNNLAVISSLLSLQSDYIKDKDDLELFRESQTRAKSMALIHERLYQSEDLKRIDFSDYIKTLASDLFQTYSADPELIKLKMNLIPVMIDINNAIPLGLILNELVSNSMKYAFPGDKNGEINIKLESNDDKYILTVSDNGVGLPEGLDFQKTESLGLQLVNSLTNQIDGTIELDKTLGTKFIIKFQEEYSI